jgi:hypothetical protein
VAAVFRMNMKKEQQLQAKPKSFSSYPPISNWHEGGH